jgi:translation initiation factor RLI1
VATSIDYFGAMLRIMLVAVSTMMDVLVIQHDILITEAIAYLVMFKGEPGGSGE